MRWPALARAVGRVVARVVAEERCARRNRERSAGAARVRRSRQHALSCDVLCGMDRADRRLRADRAPPAVARRSTHALALRVAGAGRVRGCDQQDAAHAAAARAHRCGRPARSHAPRAHELARGRACARRVRGRVCPVHPDLAGRPDDRHDPSIQQRRRRLHRAGSVRERSAGVADRDRHRSRLRDLLRPPRVAAAGSARPHLRRPRQFHAHSRARRAAASPVDRRAARGQRCSRARSMARRQHRPCRRRTVREAAPGDPDPLVVRCMRIPRHSSSCWHFHLLVLAVLFSLPASSAAGAAPRSTRRCSSS